MTTIEKINPKKTARIAGFLYLLAIVFTMIGVTAKGLIMPGDAATTAKNIMANEFQFRLGFMSELIAYSIYIFLVLTLYKLLKSVNKNHAVLMGILILVSLPIAMLNMLNQFAALLLLNGGDYLTAFTADQLQAGAMFFLELLDYGVYITFIFWGLWLFPMGYLVFKSGFLPKILGILLMIGCFGYLIDFVTLFLFPDFVEIRFFTFIGEPVFILWLLIKGVNVEKWEKRALEST
jgi:hypothetical protein